MLSVFILSVVMLNVVAPLSIIIQPIYKKWQAVFAYFVCFVDLKRTFLEWLFLLLGVRTFSIMTLGIDTLSITAERQKDIKTE